MYRKYLLEIEQKQNAETASMWAIPEKYRFAKAKNKKNSKYISTTHHVIYISYEELLTKYTRTRNHITDIIKHHNPTGIDIYKIRVHTCV